MITEVCTLNINRSVQSSLSQVKAPSIYQATKSSRYEGLVNNLPDRVLTSAADSCVSLHGSERGGSIASDFSQSVCVPQARQSSLVLMAVQWGSTPRAIHWLLLHFCSVLGSVVVHWQFLQGVAHWSFAGEFCYACRWIYQPSPSRMTFRQIFQQPHPSSIPFVLVEMLSTLQYLPHAVEVGLWHERCNI